MSANSNSLEKQTDESFEEYFIRICENRERLGLTYKKIADLLNEASGQNFGESAYRKRYADMTRGIEYARRHFMSDHTANAMLELQKERIKLADQRREFKKLISTEGRFEHLQDVLACSVQNLEQTVGVLKFCDHADRYLCCSENEAIVVFADWHYGMIADNVFNKYDTKICKSRVCSVIEQCKEKILLHRCEHIHIVILGDLFHGAIHTSARVASEELVCDQIMEVAEILAQAINELSCCTEQTTVYMTYGNHGRAVPNKKESIHRDNLERLIPWWLKQRLRNNETVEIADDTGNEFLFITAAGHEICASHGDIDKAKTSPRLLSTLFFKQYGKNIEYILLGDKHHRETFEELGITSVVCGSLCGSDDYANDKRLYSTPSQMLLIVNQRIGVDAEYRIKCS